MRLYLYKGLRASKEEGEKRMPLWTKLRYDSDSGAALINSNCRFLATSKRENDSVIEHLNKDHHPAVLG